MAARTVEIRYVRQTGCPSRYAAVTIDVEAVEDGSGYAFIDARPGDDVHWAVEAMGGAAVEACLTALSKGIREGFRESGQVVRAVLRRAGFHPVDSGPMAFREAGRLAAAEALLTGGEPRSASGSR
jgi:translation elongation factor EF-G